LSADHWYFDFRACMILWLLGFDHGFCIVFVVG
jgi:hypothetical protein